MIAYEYFKKCGKRKLYGEDCGHCDKEMFSIKTSKNWPWFVLWGKPPNDRSVGTAPSRLASVPAQGVATIS